jgi:hypothetical protein
MRLTSRDIRSFSLSLFVFGGLRRRTEADARRGHRAHVSFGPSFLFPIQPICP